jgi:hypothetical protein
MNPLCLPFTKGEDFIFALWQMGNEGDLVYLDGEGRLRGSVARTWRIGI